MARAVKIAWVAIIVADLSLCEEVELSAAQFRLRRTEEIVVTRLSISRDADLDYEQQSMVEIY